MSTVLPTDPQRLFKREPSKEWTAERIGGLSVEDIKQLRANAERLNEVELVALCSEALKAAPAGPATRRRATPSRASLRTSLQTKPRKLIPRTRAFQARGVWLQDPGKSWSGVRLADGSVVMALWAAAVAFVNGSCNYLLWRPNVGGERPWSDTPAGKERLDHCKRALERGCAEGLLVYGETLDGRLPEDRAYSVHGVDADTVLAFAVERRGAEYWAVWGKAAAPDARQPQA